jgi:hypothetical protein
MIVLSDTAFHAAEGDPSNLKVCPRGAWQDRMLVETVLSMLTLVCHFVGYHLLRWRVSTVHDINAWEVPTIFETVAKILKSF